MTVMTVNLIMPLSLNQNNKQVCTQHSMLISLNLTLFKHETFIALIVLTNG